LMPRRGRITPSGIEALDDASLRGAGISGIKLAALRDLAAKSRAGIVPTQARLDRMGDEELIERLTQVRGIGRWTVEMLLMHRLGRPDILPVDDFGVRKGFAVTYGKREMPPPKALAKFGERWKPYRSVASWYLWRAADIATQRERVQKAQKPSAASDQKSQRRA